jgi:hypothetical protein
MISVNCTCREVPKTIRSNLLGRQFGRWSVIGYAGRMGNGKYRYTGWWCRCECGAVAMVQAGNLTSGATTQCAACARKQVIGRPRTHGASTTNTYRAWASMRQRGMLVQAWRSYEQFRADIGERPAGARLRRYNSARLHGPGNSYWATAAEHKRIQAEYLAKQLGDPSQAEHLATLTRERWRQLRNRAAGRCVQCAGRLDGSYKRYCRKCGDMRYSGRRRKRGATDGECNPLPAGVG